MRQFTFILLMVGTCLGVYAQEAIEGIWQTGKDNTIIEIQKSANHWIGKVVSSDHEDATPGQVVIRNLVRGEDDWKGEFYVPPLDSWLDATVVPQGNDIEVTVFVGWFSKSLVWKKLE